MSKKPRSPRAPGNCPKGGDHNAVKTNETATHVTHRCSKCGYTETRPKQTGRADLGYLVLAAIVLLVAMTPLWLAAGVAGP